MPKVSASPTKKLFTAQSLLPLAAGKKKVLEIAKQKNLVDKLESMTEFQKAVLAGCVCVPKGAVTTYGKLAAFIGHAGSARAVGMALSVNPLAPEVPCHRVVGSTGYLTGFSGVAGVSQKKVSLLKGEGVAVDNSGYVNKVMIIK